MKRLVSRSDWLLLRRRDRIAVPERQLRERRRRSLQHVQHPRGQHADHRLDGERRQHRLARGAGPCMRLAGIARHRSLDLVGSGAGGIGGISQTFDTVPGQTYVVSFDLAGNFGAPPVIKPLAVTVNGVTTNFTFDTTGATGTNMGWVTRSVQFTATGDQQHDQFRQRRQRVRRHVERRCRARQRAGHAACGGRPGPSRFRWTGRTGRRCCC